MGADELLFMNWAYEEDRPMALPLAASDEPNRFFIQLYSRIATQVDLTGKRVLEVGCDHGGGASYLVRTLRPASYTGLNRTRPASHFAEKATNCPAWISCRATPRTCPSPTNPSTPCSMSNPRTSILGFRVSSPKLRACCAREGISFTQMPAKRNRIAEWEAALAAAPMRLISERVIEEEVMRGLEKTQRIIGLVSHRAPASLLTWAKLVHIAAVDVGERVAQVVG
jgi:hypothetical protein